MLEVAKEQAHKVSVHTLITANELVGERKTRHKTAFLESEDGLGHEGTQEEDAFNGIWKL